MVAEARHRAGAVGHTGAVPVVPVVPARGRPPRRRALACGAVLSATLAAGLAAPLPRPAQAAAAAAVVPPPGVPGMDVSNYQGAVDWAGAWAGGARFAYVKATEGPDYASPAFGQQYGGAYDVGMIRGAYHFGRPDLSGGTVQADWFVDHGGSWSADGRTLPPLLDMEYAPVGDDICFGVPPATIMAFVQDFVGEVARRTGRPPAVFSTTNWWNQCTGRDASLGADHPLVLSRWNPTSPLPLPAGWTTYAMWQWKSLGAFAGDQEVFNGTYARLQQFALGG